MKLCIPTMGGEGPAAMICDHFGSAPEFTLYDQKTKECETIRNPKIDGDDGHGQCRPMDLLKNRNIVAVICRGMGRNAVSGMDRSGIKVYTTQGATVQDAIDDFMAGRLVKLDPENSCMGRHIH